MTEPMRKAGFTGQFIFTSPAEALMLYMKMAFFVGIFLAAPFVLWEIWGFISPGLYKNEKKWAFPFIGMGTLFFIGGRPLRALLPVPDDLPASSTRSAGRTCSSCRRIGEYWSFYSWFLLGLGLVFQIPVVIFVLARLGLVTPGLPAPRLEVRDPRLVHPLGDHHADPRRGDPDGARRAR